MLPLTTDLSDLDGVPYFLWNEPTTVRRLREILSDPENVMRPLYAARLMREGRVLDVWQFLTLQDILALWPQVERHMGRRRDFWRFLLDTWKEIGAL